MSQLPHIYPLNVTFDYEIAVRKTVNIRIRPVRMLTSKCVRMRTQMRMPLYRPIKHDKNSSGDEIANVNFYAVRPGGTRIR